MCRIRLSKSHKLIYYLYIKYLSGNKHILHIAICRFIHEEANTIYFCVFLRLDFFFFFKTNPRANPKPSLDQRPL